MARHVPEETPPRMMPLDGLAAFVPAIEEGARLALAQVTRERAAFRPTGMEHYSRIARQLDTLAANLDVRKRP